jgi:hypothetical protein
VRHQFNAHQRRQVVGQARSGLQDGD